MRSSSTPTWRGVCLAMLLLASVAGCGPNRADHSANHWADGCTPADRDEHSVARVWDEVTLQLIREVVPAPTVHARNLFHLSAAMWDGWAAFDPDADGYLVTEKHPLAATGSPEEIAAAREVAISYAAYRILLWRFATVADLATATDELGAVMASLCFRTDVVTTNGDSPAALGNRIAEAVLAYGSTDGANEDERYADHDYQPVNEPLVVDESGTTLVDPNRWQPLSLGLQLSQNGLPIPGNVQVFIGSQWGHVRPFAQTADADGLVVDPGPPPLLHDPTSDDDYEQAALDIIRYTSLLDPDDPTTIDIGPGSLGDNPLGTNDGHGHATDPTTGEPYEPDRSLRADFGRVIAEYWADGPTSETPPGHWNVLANQVADSPDLERRIGGTGPLVDPLEWDVKTYLALNGALHDAAIAAWGVKSHYDSVRPISMIRYLGGNGQSSDPDQPSYDPDGLPLEPGLVEVITEESSAPGQRHEELAGHVGEITVRSWRGSPDDPETETSGVDWILAVDWVPYQRPTFVTPSFAGYISGHSTFSRAGAEVLAAVTDSPYFPGGLGSWLVPAGSLLHEEGPTADVVLQWATYFDASDQAGISRLYGGIHIPQDDVAGRRIGAELGGDAWTLALRYYDGTAMP